MPCLRHLAAIRPNSGTQLRRSRRSSERRGSRRNATRPGLRRKRAAERQCRQDLRLASERSARPRDTGCDRPQSADGGHDHFDDRLYRRRSSRAIRRILKGEKLVSVEVAFKIVENGSRHHGHVDAVLSAMRQLGFEKLVGSRHSPERDLVVAMVVARILEPQSKLATSQWWHTTTLPEILGVSDAREDDLYAAMD